MSLTRLLALYIVIGCFAVIAQPTLPIPKTWEPTALEAMQVPLADPRFTPVQVGAEYYYKMPVLAIYKSYPVYLPGKEPAGYEEWLKHQEPQVAFDLAQLKTDADLIRAGELVFDAPFRFSPYDPSSFERRYLRVHVHQKLRETKHGVIPYYRLVIRKKGTLELGSRSCGSCHTRIQPDGTTIKGAQGTFPNISLGFVSTPEGTQRLARFLYATPWIQPDPLQSMMAMNTEEITTLQESMPPGVIARSGTSPFSPTQVPDLIGIKDRRYLDHTGLQRHAGPGDIMRYAALNQGAAELASFGGFIPITARSGKNILPPPEEDTRYSDEQLYALSQYLYSLKSPPNPNQHDAKSRQGEVVFRREGCPICHTPPLYTNNKLTPVIGFRVPAAHKTKYDVLPIVVGTNPVLATSTRRGTGYYKVPSLKGLWYRGPFEHRGSVATLEDWFDPARLNPNYVPTGFVGYKVNARAVEGHEFGLKLSSDDKAALIAFLKTL